MRKEGTNKRSTVRGQSRVKKKVLEKFEFLFIYGLRPKMDSKRDFDVRCLTQGLSRRLVSNIL